MEVKWFIGKVIDNNDPDKLGRVKAILYEIDSSTEKTENLVWCYPDQTLQNIPEINDKFWFKVVDPPYLTKRFYTTKIQREAYNDFNIFDTSIKSAITGYSGAYPNNKGFFTKSKNGIVFNSTTGETVLLGKSSYVYINGSNEIEIKAGTIPTEKSLLGETTIQMISDILDGIIALTVTCSAPTVASSPPINLATFTVLKAQLQTLLSAKVKNN